MRTSPLLATTTPGAWVVYDHADTYEAVSIHGSEADALAAADGAPYVAFWRFGEDVETAVRRAIHESRDTRRADGTQVEQAPSGTGSLGATQVEEVGVLASITYRSSDALSIAEEHGVPAETALMRAEEWADAVADTASALLNEQMASAIRFNTP